MSQITIQSPKGSITGTADECAAWLAEQQPTFPAVHVGDEHEELTVQGTPGAAGYRRAIEGALQEIALRSGYEAAERPASEDAGRPQHVLTPEQTAALREHDRLLSAVESLPLDDETGTRSDAEDALTAWLASPAAAPLGEALSLQETGPLLSADGDLLRHSAPALRGEG